MSILKIKLEEAMKKQNKNIKEKLDDIKKIKKNVKKDVKKDCVK